MASQASCYHFCRFAECVWLHCSQTNSWHTGSYESPYPSEEIHMFVSSTHSWRPPPSRPGSGHLWSSAIKWEYSKGIRTLSPIIFSSSSTPLFDSLTPYKVVTFASRTQSQMAQIYQVPGAHIYVITEVEWREFQWQTRLVPPLVRLSLLGP